MEVLSGKTDLKSFNKERISNCKRARFKTKEWKKLVAYFIACYGMCSIEGYFSQLQQAENSDK